jgi:hypothetical protein
MDIFNKETEHLIPIYENKNFINDLKLEIEDETIFSSKSTSETEIPAFDIKKKKDIFLEEDNDGEERKLYFNKKEESINSECNIFQVKKEGIRCDNFTPHFTNKKRGRKIEKENSKYKREHKRDSPDNILRKIQVHFLNFIVYFLNIILINFNFKQKLVNLDYNFKKGIKKESINALKSKSIGELISGEISKKYKSKDKNFNQKIYKEIKDDKIISKILSLNCVDFFKNIYFQNNKIIDLREYGSDRKIKLTNELKMFKGLLNKNKDIKKIYQSIKKNYLPDLVFLIK